MNKNLNMVLRYKLKQLRSDLNLTIDELCDEIDKFYKSKKIKTPRLNKSMISRWENNLSIPDLINLKKYVEFFNITYDDILKEV